MVEARVLFTHWRSGSNNKSTKTHARHTSDEHEAVNKFVTDYWKIAHGFCRSHRTSDRLCHTDDGDNLPPSSLYMRLPLAHYVTAFDIAACVCLIFLFSSSLIGGVLAPVQTATATVGDSPHPRTTERNVNERRAVLDTKLPSRVPNVHITSLQFD